MDSYRFTCKGGPGPYARRARCHGPGCSRSRRVMGSYGRSTGIEDLVDTSREHGHSAVSMETMDSYGLTCEGGPSTATRRTKLKEQAQPRRGPSSRNMQMVTTQGLERQEPKELSLIKGGGAVSKEEQCRRSRHQVMRRRSSVEGVSGPDIDRTEGSSPLRSGDHFKHQVNTLDTRVDATNLITNPINLIITDITNLITNTINLIIINTHTRPWCHHNIDIDRAELPLNGVSTEVSRNLR
ncbi:hypothetical protein NDA12_004641 [Ustilago hordei]|nr:hypothetical protein NDA12_004641 [Ustilago hordei]